MAKQFKLHLPKTAFPQRPNSSRFKNQTVIDRITSRAYETQQTLAPSSAATFSILDGPPFANGPLHIGHFLNKVVKDILNRFQSTFRSKRIQYTPGWDCHGLPIELLVKKSNQMLPSEIRIKAQQVALAAIDAQAKDFESWGVLANWSQKVRYTTMDHRFEEAEMKLFARLFAQKLISRRLKPVFWSPESQTALAEAELEYMDNFESQCVFVRFPLVNFSIPGVSLLAWTTTPWTLPGNMAVAVHEEAEYALVKQSKSNALFLVAKERVAFLESLSLEDTGTVFLGRDLCKHEAISPISKHRVPILHGGFVTMDVGTGLVHLAPFHGMDDFECCLQHFGDSLLKREPHVDTRGRFKPGVVESGTPLALTEGNLEICAVLKRHDLLCGDVHVVKHRYPINWRTKTPILTLATEQFFLQLLPQQAQKLCTDQIQFVPESGKVRLVNTIGSRKEWCLSRQRVWGLPIPYFKHKDDGNQILLTEDMILRFATECGKRGSNFWFTPTVEDDALLLSQADFESKLWVRGTDTLDVWFDSGSVSWVHHEAKADVVVEGSDQHRGWFQSSILLHSAAAASSPTTTTVSPPFRTIVTHGFVLDESGQKMSKSLGNVVTPQQAIDRFAGNVDVLRLWVATAEIVQDVGLGELSLNQAGDMMKKLRIWWRFFISLGTPQTEFNVREMSPLSRAILHSLSLSCQAYKKELDDFHIRLAVKSTLSFLQSDALKCYVECTKDTMYCDQEHAQSRQTVLHVFQKVLESTVSMMSPVCVFTADELVHEHGVRIGSCAEIFSFEEDFAALQILLRLRAEINRLQISEETRPRTHVQVVFSTQDEVDLMSRFLLQTPDQQWSEAAGVLQVLHVSVSLGKEYSLSFFENESAAKCVRCRKPHVSVGKVSTPDMCTRCLECEDM